MRFVWSHHKTSTTSPRQAPRVGPDKPMKNSTITVSVDCSTSRHAVQTPINIYPDFDLRARSKPTATVLIRGARAEVSGSFPANPRPHMLAYVEQESPKATRWILSSVKWLLHWHPNMSLQAFHDLLAKHAPQAEALEMRKGWRFPKN